MPSPALFTHAPLIIYYFQRGYLHPNDGRRVVPALRTSLPQKGGVTPVLQYGGSIRIPQMALVPMYFQKAVMLL